MLFSDAAAAVTRSRRPGQDFRGTARAELRPRIARPGAPPVRFRESGRRWIECPTRSSRSPATSRRMSGGSSS